MTAEPLKPQAWMVEAAKEIFPAEETLSGLHPNRSRALRIILAHAPSGSPPALEPFGKNFYDSGTVWQAGSVASQEAPRFHPDVDGTVDDLAVTIVGDVLSGKDGNFVVNRVAARLNALIGLERSRIRVASQEAAQPIPSIADVSDHNPNDPSCKACGSAMVWKCLSCGSTLPLDMPNLRNRLALRAWQTVYGEVCTLRRSDRECECRGGNARKGVSPVSKEAEVIQVIVTRLLKRGTGENEDSPIRIITQYWTLDGELLAEVDPCGRRP